MIVVKNILGEIESINGIGFGKEEQEIAKRIIEEKVRKNESAYMNVEKMWIEKEKEICFINSYML